MNVSREMILKPSPKNVSHSELELTVYVALFRIVSSIKNTLGQCKTKMNNWINSTIKNIVEPLSLSRSNALIKSFCCHRNPFELNPF